jgi:hypothetical protein
LLGAEIAMSAGSCAGVLEHLLDLGDQGRLPWVLLRPRAFDDETVFEGDFDLLIDEPRFGEILDAVFQACQQAGISFIVRQTSAFKRQIELLDGDSRAVTLELWRHAEFRIRPGHGLLSRAALDYRAFQSVPAEQRPSLRAALFLLHLHHKQKRLDDALTRWRLRHFQDSPPPAPVLRDVLAQLESGQIDLEQARGRVLEWLRSLPVPVKSPARVACERAAWKVRRALRLPAPRTTPLVGPDGSGKSALMDAIGASVLGRRLRFQRFKRFFRRLLFHLIQSEPRNVRDEKVLWLILPVAWACFVTSRWLTGWARPILVDRYFYDYFVREVRNPTQPLRRIAAYDFCSVLAPLPRHLIVASCPPAVIRQRKTEMTVTSMERLYQVYLDQVARFGVPETLFCHTGIDLATSCRQVVAFLEGTSAVRAAR